jgi:hypothetical protein
MSAPKPRIHQRSCGVSFTVAVTRYQSRGVLVRVIR